MDPEVWGPCGWRILHRMAYTFKKRADALRFYNSLHMLLPCSTCQMNFKRHFAALPFPSKVQDVGKWVFDVHNRVNDMKGKPPYEVVYPQVKQTYKRARIDSKEWVFILAIVEMHPGKRSASPEYLSELSTFLEAWTASSDVVMPDNISSKMVLRRWAHTYIKKHGVDVSRKTCSDTCTL